MFIGVKYTPMNIKYIHRFIQPMNLIQIKLIRQIYEPDECSPISCSDFHLLHYLAHVCAFESICFKKHFCKVNFIKGGSFSIFAEIPQSPSG
jgi:hypothetical protein